MQVLFEVLIESIILIAFLWIGKSILKAQLYFMPLAITGFAGALASQVPFVGIYLSFLCALLFVGNGTRGDIPGRCSYPNNRQRIWFSHDDLRGSHHDGFF